MNKLIIASAGAGKSRQIVEQALRKANEGQVSLILTYTQNNQNELLNKICKINGFKPSNIIIKGWFSFLLEDMIRPYQGCIFKNRISGIHFNSSDPHKRNGRTIKGRSEKKDGAYNPDYFLTKKGDRAHTTYLSKFAVRILKETKSKTSKRLSEIYDTIFIDEVQDLIGWDFDIIEALAKTEKCSVLCVGDFRQTLYSTAITQKKPKITAEKIDRFDKMGFEQDHRCISWRCIQSICDFADLVHEDECIYPCTESQIVSVPCHFNDHIGVFTVSPEMVSDYIECYNPVILRQNKKIQEHLCSRHQAFNFGESKGLGFDNVLIFPTVKYKNFLSGKKAVFEKDKTEKAKNNLYVAATRARYSVAFVYDGSEAIEGIKQWKPE